MRSRQAWYTCRVLSGSWYKQFKCSISDIQEKHIPSFGEMQTSATDLAFLHDPYINYCCFFNEIYMLRNKNQAIESMTTEMWVLSVTLTSSSSYRA